MKFQETYLTDLRKELHQHPEISGNEEKTAERIRKELLGCNPDEIQTGLGGHGILALFKCSEGKAEETILFRAELDAISVQEETGLSYQSKNKNSMHACGHDGHMAILTGLAKRLSGDRPEKTDVYLLFQPSEETGEGAEKVLKDSRFQELEIDHSFALHNLPGFPEKEVICKKETFAAGSIGIEISFAGSFSHAAYPEKGINPATTVAGLIQKIDREMKAFRSESDSNKAVCTYIKMGERAFGISPGKAKVGFTIRSESDDKLEQSVNRIFEIIEETNQIFEGDLSAEKVEPFRATVNDDEGVQIVKKVSWEKGLNYRELKRAFPWSEDFGEFRRKFPITIFGLGMGEQKPPLHSEIYDFNDELIPVGVAILYGIIEYYEYLQDE